MTDQMFKPGYEGARPSTRLTGPEKQRLLLGKAALVERLHTALLTMAAMEGRASLGIGTGATPAHLEEFADRVGQEKEPEPPARFQPTAAQVSDMDKALGFLEGLRPAFFKVVLLRALHEFAKENGEQGDWPWKRIGGFFGLSERWAESAYDAAIIQAARRSGLLPMCSQDHSVLVVAVWHDRAWLTNLSTTADPRAAVANLKVKSPIALESAFAVWVAGQPVAKRVVELAKPGMRNLLSHGSWYKANPDAVAETLVDVARSVAADWLIEDIAIKGRLAA